MTLDDDLEKAGNEIMFKEETELGQVMSNLDSDDVDKTTGMSSIDFNTRLQDGEISSMMITDEFIRMGILPKEIGITRQKKRLAVSLKGMGREEKVRIVAGERERQAGGSFMDKVKGLFTPNQ